MKLLKYNTKDFIRNVGRVPEDDDLERANCKEAGKQGHKGCGVCVEHNKPVFECSICFVLSARGIFVERF